MNWKISTFALSTSASAKKWSGQRKAIAIIYDISWKGSLMIFLIRINLSWFRHLYDTFYYISLNFFFHTSVLLSVDRDVCRVKQKKNDDFFICHIKLWHFLAVCSLPNFIGCTLYTATGKLKLNTPTIACIKVDGSSTVWWQLARLEPTRKLSKNGKMTKY